MARTYKFPERCQRCVYYSSYPIETCDFCMKTGELRGCSIDNNCNRFKDNSCKLRNKIIVIPPRGKALIFESENELIPYETMSRLTGGKLEMFDTYKACTKIVANKEAQTLQLPKNELATDCLKMDCFDKIYGTALWTAVKDNACVGFTQERANKIIEALNGPETEDYYD